MISYDHHNATISGPDGTIHPGITVPVAEFADAGFARLNRPAGRIVSLPATVAPGAVLRIPLRNSTLEAGDRVEAMAEPEGTEITDVTVKYGEAWFTVKNTGKVPLVGAVTVTFAKVS